VPNASIAPATPIQPTVESIVVAVMYYSLLFEISFLELKKEFLRCVNGVVAKEDLELYGTVIMLYLQDLPLMYMILHLD
jgi:hypothetical protein